MHKTACPAVLRGDKTVHLLSTNLPAGRQVPSPKFQAPSPKRKEICLFISIVSTVFLTVYRFSPLNLGLEIWDLGLFKCHPLRVATS